MSSSINIIKENVSIVINSNYRNNPTTSTTSNFTYSVDDQIDRIEEIIIKNVQIPYTFYNFKSNIHNVLTFNSGVNSITIPPANYTTTTLATTLKSLIDTELGGTSTVITFATNTGLLTISRNALFKVDAAIDVPASTASNLLGFTVSSITSLSVTGNYVFSISGNVFNTSNVLTFNSGAVVVTITPGNYTITSLAAELKAKIDTAFADTTTVIAFSTSTYKLTITRGTAFVLDAAVSQPTSTAATALGFYISSTSSTTATSDGVYNISGPNYILLKSNFLVKAANRKFIFSNNSYGNVLAVIPILVSAGDIISIPDTDLISIHLSYKFTIRKTDLIDISITDENGALLNLNNSPIAIQLLCITG